MKKKEIRYVREIIFGKRGKRTYWEITTDPETFFNTSRKAKANFSCVPRQLL